MPSIQEATESYRRRVLAREKQAAAQLTDAYTAVLDRLRPQIDALSADVERIRAAGDEPTRAQLVRLRRYHEIEEQLLDELARLATLAEEVVTAGQADLLVLASEQSLVATLAGLPPGATLDTLARMGLTFNRLPTESLVELMGALADGSPLSDLLDELGAETAKAARDALIEGLLLGYNPAKVAAMLDGKLGDGLTRALRVSRTELLRAYREASRKTWLENRHVIREWRWTASLSRRSCPACLAMHGTLHPLDEPMASHVNCRCVPSPRTRSWRELGFPIDEPEQQWESGEAWLRRQPDAVQLEILGYSRYKLWKLGDASLADMAVRRENPKWGASVQVKPLREMRKVAA